jgi:hypothetical protein
VASRDRPRVNHGKHRKRKRGTHKRATSPETVLWESELLIPKRPVWMDPATYRGLAEMRRSL